MKTGLQTAFGDRQRPQAADQPRRDASFQRSENYETE